MGVLEEEGGQQASCLVVQHAVEFPQVLASSKINNCIVYLKTLLTQRN